MLLVIERSYLRPLFYLRPISTFVYMYLIILQAKMKIDLQSLYESLLIGSSPCHGFTKVERGNMGGFYHIVCRHGVPTAYIISCV